jgi:hypothetical protein
MAIVTMALAALNAVAVHGWWTPDRSAALVFAVIDASMAFVVLAALLTIIIAETGRYELNLVLMAATVLTVPLALFVFWGDPLLYLVALSLLITTIVSGLAMNRAWRVTPA